VPLLGSKKVDAIRGVEARPTTGHIMAPSVRLTAKPVNETPLHPGRAKQTDCRCGLLRVTPSNRDTWPFWSAIQKH
jgi:hypothetical protein